MLSKKSSVKQDKTVGLYEDAVNLKSTSNIFLRDAGRVVINTDFIEIISNEVIKKLKLEHLTSIFSLSFVTQKDIKNLISKSMLFGYSMTDITSYIRKFKALKRGIKVIALINITDTNVNIIIASNGRFVLKDKENKGKRVFEDIQYPIDNLDIHNVDTSILRSLEGIFKYGRYRYINMQGLNLKKVKDMQSMCSECTYLEHINLTGATFSKNTVENINAMFYNCEALKEIDLSGIVTDKAKYLSAMFCNCTHLEKINMQGISIEHCKSIKNLFRNCTSLKEIKMGSINLNTVVSMKKMLENCNEIALEQIEFTGDNIKHLIAVDNVISLNHITPMGYKILKDFIDKGIIGAKEVYRAWVDSFCWQKIEYRYRNLGITSEHLKEYYMQLIDELVTDDNIESMAKAYIDNKQSKLVDIIPLKFGCKEEFIYADAVLRLIAGKSLKAQAIEQFNELKA